MSKREIIVMLPTGSRAEAEQARLALGHPNRSLAMGTVGSHMAGQRLPCDVVVVGQGGPTLERDAAGHQVYRVDSIDDLAKLDLTKPPGAAQKAEEVPQEQPGADEAAAPEEPPQPTPDAFDDMNRVELIQHAAQHWPGQRQWANMGNPELRATIRELSAG